MSKRFTRNSFRRKNPIRHRTTEELIIEQKSSNFVKAIKAYWSEQERLQKEFNKTSAAFNFRPCGEQIFPTDLSGIVWLLKDGLVFVRYKSVGK